MSTQNIGFIDPAAWSAVLEFPLAEPPKDILPDYESPTFHGTPVFITSAICLPFLLLALAVRVYAKTRIVKRITPDDYIYFISWPAGVAFICLHLAIIAGGAYGYHAWDVKIGDLTKSIIIRSQVLQSTGGVLSWLTRLCLFSLIWFAFAPLRWTKTLVYGGVIVSGVIYLIPMITLAIVCRPRGGTDQVAYIAGMASMQCADTKGIGQRMAILLGVLNVVLDFYILLLPIPAIKKLQVSRKRKVGIYLVFLAAVVGCLTSVVALVFRIRYLGNQDVTFAIIPIFTVNIVETTVGLMILCAASFASVWRHARKGISNSTQDSSFRTLPSEVSGWAGKSTTHLTHDERKSSSQRSCGADATHTFNRDLHGMRDITSSGHQETV